MHLGRGGISCFGLFSLLFFGCFYCFLFRRWPDKETQREVRERRFVKICKFFSCNRGVVIVVI